MKPKRTAKKPAAAKAHPAPGIKETRLKLAGIGIHASDSTLRMFFAGKFKGLPIEEEIKKGIGRAGMKKTRTQPEITVPKKIIPRKELRRLGLTY